MTRSLAFSALRWTLAGSIAQRLVTFGAVSGIARIISETEYGAYRQLLSLHLIFFVLLPLGFDQLYIREVERRSQFARLMAGALTVASGLVMAVMLAGHQVISGWMKFETWSGMLWVFAAIVPVQAWKVFYKTELAARLNYRSISLGETLYACVTGGGGLALVLLWPTAWSLYIAYACAELAELTWLRLESRLALPAWRDALREFWQNAHRWKRFGLFHCGMQVLNAIGGNAPVIIFGAAVSKSSAAAFSMANYLVTVPIYILIGALHRVAYSALAGLSREQLVAPILKMLEQAAAFIVPGLILLMFLARPAVLIVLGESWVDGTAPIVQMVAGFCIFVALFSPISSIDLLLDRPDYGFYWNVGATAVRVAAVLLGLRYGTTEAVAAYCAASAVVWFVWGALLGRLLGAGQWTFHRAWLKLLPMWAALAAMLYFVDAAVAGLNMGKHTTAVVQIALGCVAGGIYGGGIWLCWPGLVKSAIEIVKR